MKTKVKKAIFPVAGLGTRFLPATKSIPKEIMTLVDRPLIQYTLDEARSSGIKEFIFVTSRGKGALEDYFDHSPILENHLHEKGNPDLLRIVQETTLDSGTIAYVRQHYPKGLGHAIWCARHLIGDEPFAVVLTDDVIISEEPVLSQMIAAYEHLGGIMVGLSRVARDKVSNYGIVEPEASEGQALRLKGMVEKPTRDQAPSDLAIIGRYILTPRIFDVLAKTQPDAKGEIQITEAIANETGGSPGVFGFVFEGQRFDCGSKLGFLQAGISLALQRTELKDNLQAFLKSLDLT
ncbi:MAG: UTP--glucose-1-phosphate uridylyltransferase [Rhodobacteraceae bacterium]|nr:UTP--glucose-1-phosphate uridylyltransferase [Paracoccaceae bacterium]MCY4249931.1 UTP--glucose-1-phosphate uridylyltransferase [Paracoccaceae bacterium]